MRILWLTWKVYGLSIWLYPADLRNTYGDEMREAFRRQTLDAYEAGAFELLRVLECAAVELVTCALPLRAQSPAAIVGAAALLSAALIILPLLWALHNPIPLKHLADTSAGLVSRAIR